jgi:lipopolysaccharide/colanic/teichoic acid biosynthesis glycosyltransferase
VPELRAVSKYERFVKPVLDRTAGVVLSIITLPVLALAIGAIWATMGFPAIFQQARVGRYGREFTVYKLRTMRHDRRVTQVDFSGPDRRVNHKSPQDPRHTKLGRFLRKWSIDELPQLWNVARGDMSLIGPRPELPQLVEKYEPWQHQRHETRPGMTGLWQVTARGDIPMHEATELDIEYVQNVTLAADLRILLLTVPAMLGVRKGS